MADKSITIRVDLPCRMFGIKVGADLDFNEILNAVNYVIAEIAKRDKAHVHGVEIRSVPPVHPAFANTDRATAVRP